MTLLEICEWLEGTALGILVRESLYGFQILVATHILGLVFSVGILLWVDLRLLGIALTRTPVSAVQRSAMPWFVVGFVAMFVSGAALFTGFATAAYGNVFFRIKLAAIVLAGVNALVLHFVTQRSAAAWDSAPTPPAAVRFAGAASLALWVAVVLAGRMISYTMF